MKNKIIIAIIIIMPIAKQLQAQRKSYTNGNYGNTFNVGIGLGGYAGYYSYIGRSLPVININYELNVAKNFTLAPFLTAYSYSQKYYYGSQYYNYRQTVLPIGVKGSYYFDDLLKANSNWDFYGAGSIGFAIVNTSWDANYNGNKNYYANGNALFLDLHAGAEYHFNNKTGAYLDLSTGVTTLGLAFHK
jgi:hypothetical protein